MQRYLLCGSPGSSASSGRNRLATSGRIGSFGGIFGQCDLLLPPALFASVAHIALRAQAVRDDFTLITTVEALFYLAHGLISNIQYASRQKVHNRLLITLSNTYWRDFQIEYFAGNEREIKKEKLKRKRTMDKILTDILNAIAGATVGIMISMFVIIYLLNEIAG